ncbi:hypothetical protein [Algoriphagus formosus]|uniref:hypothetical protein n=1 Tax=Algoriphagus formosus TaxID=2007308 RepID=UPI000C291ABC|nr:hypothetical protein [Algoriphagus formosus]
MSHPHTYTIQFSGPGTYRIRVLGNIGKNMLDLFEGIVESVDDIGEGKVSTSIIVNVLDQAQLCGIINILYDHRLALISLIWAPSYNIKENIST